MGRGEARSLSYEVGEAKEFMDFGATKDGGRALVFPGCQGSLNDEFAVLEDGTVEEDKALRACFWVEGATFRSRTRWLRKGVMPSGPRFSGDSPFCLWVKRR